MFNFFGKKKTENDSDSEYESESESEGESECKSENKNEPKSKSEIFKDHIQKNSLFNISPKLYSATLSSSGIDYIELWELQRKIENKHVEDIFNTIKQEWRDKESISFYDPVHIAHVIDKDRYYVIDGQHRVSAYKKFHNDERPFYFPIYVHSVENEEEMLQLFKIVNKRLNIDINSLENAKLIDLEKNIKAEYGNVIRKNERNSSREYRPVNRPYLDSHEFYAEIRKNYFFQHNDAKTIFDKLKEINNSIRKLPRVKRGGKSCSKNSHDKAEKLNFFLGLDKDMKWINDLK